MVYKSLFSLLFLLLFHSSLYAQSYEELLNKALEENVALKILETNQAKTVLEGSIDTRMQNPTLEIGLSDFSPNLIHKQNDFGADVGISQSLLLPHIKEEKREISHQKVAIDRQNYQIAKLDFIYAFNLKYLAYKEAIKERELEERFVAIANDILEVVRLRYEHGTIARSEFLRAKVAYDATLNRIETKKVEALQVKNSLLLFANIEEPCEVDVSYTFYEKKESNRHPKILLSQQKVQLSQAKVELLSHSVEQVELFSSIEKEPDDTVIRFGFAVDLPMFHNQDEERQLEKINIANQQLLQQNQKKAQSLGIAQLKDENRKLDALIGNYLELLSQEDELFKMYKASYALAKVNLLKLQRVKEKIVEIERQILKNRFAIARNIIKINYLKGGAL